MNQFYEIRVSTGVSRRIRD